MKAGSAPLRVAIVGCGALAELYYARALKALAPSIGLSVEVLVDPDESRCRLLAQHFPAARVVADVKMIASAEIDIAIIASPPRFHAAQTVWLLQQGVHVLCEKPMATSLEEARQMLEASQRTGRLLAVGMFRRFFPAAQQVKDLVDGAGLGRALSFTWTEGGVFNWPAASVSFFQRASSGGGVLADVGPHILDLLLWWFGEPLDVGCEDDAMGGVESNVHIKLGFKQGVRGEVRLSRDTRVPVGTRVNFERGAVWFAGASADSMTFDLTGRGLVARSRLHRSSGATAEGAGKAAPGYPQSFMAQLENLAAAVRGAETLRVKPEEAVAVQALIERCYRVRRPMDLPWLSGAEQAGARRLAGGGNT